LLHSRNQRHGHRQGSRQREQRKCNNSGAPTRKVTLHFLVVLIGAMMYYFVVQHVKESLLDTLFVDSNVDRT
jgi:hypothetical protein